VGQTVRQGQVIYKVSGSPVVLLYGQVPAYRTLSAGMTGADVTQLNHDLVRLGYASSADITALGWDYFSWQTRYALEQLQSALGIASPSGTLSLGSAVFLPGPALITALGSSAVLGGPVSSGTVVATASSTTPVVTIALDAALQSDVKDGDPVTITLPDGGTTPGVISQISRVASSSSSNNSSNNSNNSSSANSSSTTITVLVSLDHPRAAGRLNQAPVTVLITNGSVSDTLAVPVDALLAQPGGGYAVEVTGPHGHHLVPVAVGLFDDQAGLVQVTGNLSPGQRVVVPAT
jgi:multidrug efflux pump subunit AcrA (membrane-fusion protein)